MNNMRWMARFMLLCYGLAVLSFLLSVTTGRKELAMVGLGLLVPAALFSWYAKKHVDALREEEAEQKRQKAEKEAKEAGAPGKTEKTEETAKAPAEPEEAPQQPEEEQKS